MSYCSPQRFLANNRNLLREAVLAASSVLPVTNKVIRRPTAIAGTAQVSLTGTYTGPEEALYEVEIVDDDVEVSRISVPTFSGAGSGTLSGITASGTAQVYTVELSNVGIPETTASVELAGVTIQAAAAGDAGNDTRVTVDQEPLVFTASNYSLTSDLSAGTGGVNSPFIGAAFDWDSKVLSADDQIPADAHRIAFGDDESVVYSSYKQFVNGRWEYHTVPALTRDVRAGAIIQFVTEGRTVTVTDGAATEVYEDIVTDYDLLIALRTESLLVTVDGVVVNDRSPAGMASRELSLRTDAHAEVSSGSGGYATGFTNVTVESTAGTQLVTATCFAATGADSPNARLGNELWTLDSTLLGNLGIIATGVPFIGAQFGLTIPVKLPPGFGAPKGRVGFSVGYVSRAEGETEPPICLSRPTLGSGASDKTVTFVYRARPSEDCACADMQPPNLSTSCIGAPLEGGGMSAYQQDTIDRVTGLVSWYKDQTRALSEWYLGFARDAPALVRPMSGTSPASAFWAQATQSLLTIVNNFEAVAAKIDVLEGGSDSLRDLGFIEWDNAVTEMKADIDAQIALLGSPSDLAFYSIPSVRYDAALKLALITAGIPTVGGDDASLVTGDGCWRDEGGSAWWENDEYMPIFSNAPFYFCRKTEDGIFSTHELGGQLNIKCPDDLEYGDSVTFAIDQSSWGVTYPVGAQISVPIVAASPLALTGGRDGAPISTWNVNGSVTGPMDAYLYDPDNPLAYSGGDSTAALQFLIVPGGIDFAKGDRFRFGVEGGHYRWRKDGGAWQDDSPPLAIPLVSNVLDAGLSIAFQTGAVTSFVPGDVFEFFAQQPWAVSNLQTPGVGQWKWDGSTATLEFDLLEVEQLDMLALIHSLPAGAGVTLEGGPSAGVYTDWTETLTWRVGCIWKAINRSTRYGRLSVTGATAGGIRWVWLGVPLATTLSSEAELTRAYQMNRPGSGLQGALFKGKTLSGEVSWTESALGEDDVAWTADDVEGVASMIDWLKENNDEPMIFIPQITRTADPVLFAMIATDEVTFPDAHSWNRNQGIERRLSAALPLQGVWQ